MYIHLLVQWSNANDFMKWRSMSEQPEVKMRMNPKSESVLKKCKTVYTKNFLVLHNFLPSFCPILHQVTHSPWEQSHNYPHQTF